jgi:putative ABC transport system ATP-binding protein
MTANASTHATSAAGVRATGIHKSFGSGANRVEILHGIDFELACGDLTLLVGPSGSGKTTLLCVLAGLLEPDSGEVDVFGEILGRLSLEARTEVRSRLMGFVFQQFNLLPTLTARENTAVPLLIRRGSRAAALKRAGELLERFGLSHRMDAFPRDLSGGEQQRVAVARALIGDPRFLVCDEPTASLDGEVGAQVMHVIRETAVGPDRAVVVVTHDSRVFSFGDRMARMLDGRIVSIERLHRPGPGGSR